MSDDTSDELREHERRELAIQLREKGYTLREVGDIVDRCKAWVSIAHSDDQQHP